jgi:hypothetical protein
VHLDALGRETRETTRAHTCGSPGISHTPLRSNEHADRRSDDIEDMRFVAADVHLEHFTEEVQGWSRMSGFSASFEQGFPGIPSVAISGQSGRSDYQEITVIASERCSNTSGDIDIQAEARNCNFPWLSSSR